MRRLSVLILLLILPLESFGWGKRGHDVIAYIAECHLEPAALGRVTELLDGRSMVYFANWMDSASRTKEYKHTYTWHYFNMSLKEDSSSAKRAKEGDLLSAAQLLEGQLRDETLTPQEHSVALKMFIHIIGDMHQPMHLGREQDEGGGTIPVLYFVESTSLHAVWDYHIVEGCHAWSYTEWQQQIDRVSEEQIAEIVAGDYAAWIDATHEITRKIYRSTPQGERIYYQYIDHYTPIVEQQLLNAALRLASLLNKIFAN